MRKKKNMPNKKQKLKKINEIKSLLKQVTDTVRKMNSVQLLLKSLLKPIHLSTSEDPVVKELASTILGIKQDQFNYFIENKMQLERMERNAASAYRTTRDKSYLEIIIEIKEVLTHANRAYDITELPLHLPGPNQTCNQNLCNQNLCKCCFCFKH